MRIESVRKSTEETKAAFCPECEGEFRVGPILKVGQRLTCPHCEADLEVIHLMPLELDWAFDEPSSTWEEDEDDWVDEEEEEEEDDWADDEEEEDEEDDWGDEDDDL
jgi:hypothetical protein